MLKIYYGRENLEKDRFLFDQVGETLRCMEAAGRGKAGGAGGADAGAVGGTDTSGAASETETGRNGISHSQTAEKTAGGGGRPAGGQLPEKILLIVPDQFTLQAEQNAFAYLGVPGLIDLEVLSQSRLGYRVLGEAGGSTRLHIDQYGRHMLISRIVKELETELSAYRRIKKSQSFIEMANDFITELKQNSVDPDQIADIMEQVEEGSLLWRKLADIRKIYERYEEEMKGKYIDTEDYMALFTSRIPGSRLVRKSQIWIYGFDSFTMKSMQMIRVLMRCALDVNVIMTGTTGGETEQGRETGQDRETEQGRDGELFSLTADLIFRLTRMAAQDGVLWEERAIPDTYRVTAGVGYPASEDDALLKTLPGNKKPAELQRERWADRLCKAPELLHLERELYAWPCRPYIPPGSGTGPSPGNGSGTGTGTGSGSGGQRALGFCRAANLYAEVETAAVQVVTLTRDRGLRYQDISVICNDLPSYGSVIKRVFGRYEIPVFLDEKRTVLHNPAVELTLSLLDVVTKGWRREDVFRLVKTGLFSLKTAEYEELENYAIKYKIQGRRWKKDFHYGQTDYGETGLEALNRLRVRLAAPLAVFEKEFSRAETAREKSAALYRMLAERLELPERLEELLTDLNDREEFLAAEEISQIWTVIVRLLDQIVELLGDGAISGEDYLSMLQAGFSAVEMGLLPPSPDRIIVGTMQRTRRGRVRALLVIGANDGLIPADAGKEDLLSEAEKFYLSEKDIVICKNDDYRAGEERLAIYKNLSKPEEYLWVSYSVADLDGREKKPSLIFDKLTQIFPFVPVEKDVINAESDLCRVQRVNAALPHMSEVFRRKAAGELEELSDVWKLTYDILMEKSDGSRLTSLRRGLFFTNKVKRLEEDLVRRLYKREGMEDFVLSPSRLERFGKCPFSHFVQYGLRPEERRLFEVAGREVGDVYHQCLMELSQELTRPGQAVTAPESLWMNITQEDCEARVEALMDRISGEYREGVLKLGGAEQYRGERMKKIAHSAAWAMISHVRQGLVKEIYFEAGFGEGEDKPFPPVVIEAGGQRVRIEGKIDRVDILGSAQTQEGQEAEGTGGFVKIVDYKSGSERFDMEEAREGIRLQLMLYLEGAMGGVKESRPAGVFYFEIAEPMVDASGLPAEELGAKVAEQIRKSFKMDGLMVDDPAVIRGIAGDFSGFSEVAPLRMGSKGVSGTSEGKLLTPEDFESFREEVGGAVGRLCADLVAGETAAHPKKTKYQNACRFCQFKGICFFDVEFEGCSYR